MHVLHREGEKTQQAAAKQHAKNSPLLLAPPMYMHSSGHRYPSPQISQS
jgi:hypothetical protein